MIMSIITTIMARWQIAVGILGLLILSHGLAYCEGRSDGREAAEAKQAAIELKAEQAARKADATATTTVKETTDAIEQGNQRARDAAIGDDPLGDGLRSLRRETRPDPAAR